MDSSCLGFFFKLRPSNLSEPLFHPLPNPQEDDETWVLDSSVRKHCVRCKKLLRNSHPCFDEKYKTGFSGLKSLITHTGDSSLPTQGGNKIRLLDVSCIPDSVHNIVSISNLTANFPFSIVFCPNGFVVKNLHTREEVAKGTADGNRYFWPRAQAKRRCGIKSMINSMHKQLSSCFRESVPEDHTETRGLSLGSELREAWACLRSNLDDVEDRDSWIMSSYSTQHITNDRTLLRNLSAFPEETFVSDFTGRTSPATHVGDAYLQCSQGEGIVLHGVLLVPESTTNYVSVAQLISEYPSCLEFRSDGFVLKTLDDKRLIAYGPRYKNLYIWVNKSKDIASRRGKEKAVPIRIS